MRRINTVALALLMVAGMSTVASASQHQTVANPQPQPQPSRVIRLVERATDLALIDGGAPGSSLGDRLVFSTDLFDERGRRVGRDGGDCALVRIDPAQPPEEQQIFACTITMELAEGQIIFHGLAQGLENRFAVTGGTGAYRTARGEALAIDTVPGQEAEITIRLFR